MNWLAHMVLSPDDDRVRLGNWLPDVLTPADLARISDPHVREGIRLHREIDRVMDAHPNVLRARRRLPPGVRRFAGVVLDVAYDHCLSCRFTEMTGEALPRFVARVYAGLDQLRPLLNSELGPVLDRMIEQDWLGGYGTLDGVELTLTRIRGRLSPRAHAAFQPAAARQAIETHRAALLEEFTSVWADVTHATQWRSRITAADI
jgi:acyl carrier protein phosphodiesterase